MAGAPGSFDPGRGSREPLHRRAMGGLDEGEAEMGISQPCLSSNVFNRPTSVETGSAVQVFLQGPGEPKEAMMSCKVSKCMRHDPASSSGRIDTGCSTNDRVLVDRGNAVSY